MFGIVNNNQINPSSIVAQGNAGDYLVINADGVMSIVPQNQIQYYLPTGTPNNAVKFTNSKELKNPDFVTKVNQDRLS